MREPRPSEAAVSLIDLIRKREPRELATAIPAIPATNRFNGPDAPGTVARIATVAVADAFVSEGLADTLEAFEERAAIHEFDAGMPRAEAERVAWCAVACRHYRRRPQHDPVGYCCGRSDLSPVYGDTHPLRHLPADLGESCETFEWEPMA